MIILALLFRSSRRPVRADLDVAVALAVLVFRLVGATADPATAFFLKGEVGCVDMALVSDAKGTALGVSRIVGSEKGFLLKVETGLT